MNCPKCKSDRVERSNKTWVCYDCMHIWMDSPKVKRMTGPACKCGLPATYLVLVGGDWQTVCKEHFLKHAEQRRLQTTCFKLVPDTVSNFREELLLTESK